MSSVVPRPCFNAVLNDTFKPFPGSYLASLYLNTTIKQLYDLTSPLLLHANELYRVVLALDNSITVDYLYVLFKNLDDMPLAEVITSPLLPLLHVPVTASGLVLEDRRQDESITGIVYNFRVLKTFRFQLEVRGCLRSELVAVV